MPEPRGHPPRTLLGSQTESHGEAALFEERPIWADQVLGGGSALQGHDQAFACRPSHALPTGLAEAFPVVQDFVSYWGAADAVSVRIPTSALDRYCR